MSKILRLEKDTDLALFRRLIMQAYDDDRRLYDSLAELGVKSVDDLMGYNLFLNGEASQVRFKQYSVYTDGESGLGCEVFIFVKDGVVYACDSDLRFDSIMNDPDLLTSYAPSGIVVNGDNFKLKREEGVKTPKIHVIANADDFDSNDSLCPIRSLVGEFNYSKFPEASFRCLSRFYMKQSESAAMKKVISKLKSGELVILDYVENDSIDLTDKEAQEYKTNKSLTPPKMGYSVVGTYYKYWHRPATVVFHDRAEDIYILCGQDDDSYFGVELPKQVSTIQQALKALMPKEVVKSKVFARQGEWFMIPHNENDVPSEQDAVLNIVDTEEQVFLPREPEGSRHYIDNGDIRVSSAGVVYARNFNLCHENGDHPMLDMNNSVWYSFHCNTALRSFSVEGVD